MDSRKALDGQAGGMMLVLCLIWGLQQVALGLHRKLPAERLSAVRWLGIALAFASFLVWFWLLRHYLASRLSVFSFMTPLFGTAFGVWLLDDPLEPAFIVGTVLVLTGITVVSGYGWLKSRA